MKKIIICILMQIMLLISVFFAGAVNINTKGENPGFYPSIFVENDADLPVWGESDTWVYNVEIKARNQDLNMNFDLDISNFELKVDDVLDDLYVLKLTVPQGDLNGYGGIQTGVFTFSGNIKNAYINGFFYVDKSNLKIVNCQGKMAGDTDKILLPHFDVDFRLDFEEVTDEGLVKTSFLPVKFPINVDSSWLSPFAYLNMSLKPNQPSLGNSVLYSYTDEHEVKCESWDVVDVGGTDYDALIISSEDYGDTNQIWYSPAAGNIIKVDFRNIELGFGYVIESFTLNLVSTNYEAPSESPNKPDIPVGPAEFAVGETGEYQTSSTDPDNDKIRYVFDWGDDETSYTEFVESGEQVQISHTWMKKGEHDIRVKARDKYGKESVWSDVLTVTVLNNAPEKPNTPNGPTSGRVKTSYSYSSSSTDVDGHKIRYGFDWNGDGNVDDWTGYVESGETASKSHTWTTQGVYSIKVKAQDEYGEESPWSDPLSVSMPKNKMMQLSLIRLLGKISVFFESLERFLDMR